MSWLKRLVLGRPEGRPLRTETREAEKARWWRRPGQSTDIGFLKITNIFGVAPGWKLNIHTFRGPDGHGVHRHGGRVLSLMLKGGYVEERRRGGASRWHHVRPGRINYIPLSDFHAIRRLPHGRAVTLCLIFPNVQEMEVA